MISRGRLVRIVATLFAAGALAYVAFPLLRLCGGPIGTADAWWHLKMGEVYATQGPWPDGDPLLHTAHADAPVQHEWAFDVALHGVDRHFGLEGVRVVHVLAVAGILALAASAFRRESRTLLDACFATTVFVVLAWWRLIQLRPDLVSIPATLLFHRLLLERERPASAARIAAVAALLLVWVNAHSLFAIGPLLGLAALLGLALRAGLRRWAGAAVGPGSEAAQARRLGAALVVGTLATLVNPRGIGQHLTFFTSSREAAIWAISDEWMHFDPFEWRGYGDAVSLPTWIAADAVMLAFAVAAWLAFRRFVRSPSAEGLRASDPVLFGLGAAGVVAALVSVRFLWMLVFPLLFVLRFRRLVLAPGSRPGVALAPLLAVVAVALAAIFPRIEGFRARAARVPSTLSSYLATSYDGEKFHEEAVRFLEETGVEGNLFNVYPMGGFLEYRVGPRLRTFVDGRTEHYPADVLEDYFRITEMRGTRPGESFLDVLERRGVDLFVGVGLPSLMAGRRYTSAHLERAPGWILVSRSLRHGVYLRANARNRENLSRIAAYYQRESVPFDPERGLDPGEVILRRPLWAEAHGMVPTSYGVLVAATRSPDPGRRFAALQRIGLGYALVGSYTEQLRIEREAIALNPRSPGPRRRLVYGLLRLDRPEEALEAALALQALDPQDPLAHRYVSAVREYLARRGSDDREEGPPQAVVNRLPLV